MTDDTRAAASFDAVKQTSDVVGEENFALHVAAAVGGAVLVQSVLERHQKRRGGHGQRLQHSDRSVGGQPVGELTATFDGRRRHSPDTLLGRTRPRVGDVQLTLIASPL